jgi:hypothetical protein
MHMNLPILGLVDIVQQCFLRIYISIYIYIYLYISIYIYMVIVEICINPPVDFVFVTFWAGNDTPDIDINYESGGCSRNLYQQKYHNSSGLPDLT